MKHPLELLDAAARRRLFWLAFAATLGLLILLGYIGHGYDSKQGTDGRSYGVLSFEFAATPARVTAMLATWGPDGIRAAKWNTWLDYLFMPAYATLFALSVLWAVPRGQGGRLAGLGRLLAWGQWLAALFDAAENVGLLMTLYRAPATPWPQLACACAAVKFLLLGAGLIYTLAGLLRRVRKRSGASLQSI
jgi:hypothetical protein